MNFEHILNYSNALALNNDRTWFHQNHSQYEQAKKEFTGLIDLLRFKICEECPDLAPSIMYAEPKQWMYRVAKDMRFHKNGPPYNPAFRAYISPDKKSWLPLGYYLSIRPNATIFGTGLWCEKTEDMNTVRAYLEEFFYEFMVLADELEKHGIFVGGLKLKTAPKGFSKDSPAAEYLKHKHWEVLVHIPDDCLTTFDEFIELVGYYVRAMEPMRQFLLEASKGK